MATDTYNFILAAKDNASATIARVKGEVGALGPTAAKTAGPLGTLSTVTGGLVSPLTLALGATAALTAGMATAVDNARKDEQSQRLLGAALEANIPAWDGNTTAIEATIDSRMRLGFTDEEQRESLRQLVAQTKDSTKALEIQRVAMDLARLRGIDLTTASTLLGKVWGGNVGILTRYGIQLEKGTTAQEAFAEVQRRAQGQAEAWSDGLEGQTAALGIAFDELIEKIGYAVIGPMTDLVTFANEELVPTLEDIGEAAGELANFFGQQPPGTFLGLNLEELAVNLHNAGVDFINFGVSGEKALEHITVAGKHAQEAAEEWGRRFSAELPKDIEAAGTRIAAAADQAITTPMRAAMAAVRTDTAAQLGQLPAEVGDAIVDNLPDLKSSMKELREMLKHELDPQTRIHRLQGMLNSRALADAMKSEDPYVRARAKEIRAGIRDEIVKLKTLLPQDGQDAIFDLGEGMKRRKVHIARVAQDLARGVRNNLEFDATAAGQSVADTWISGVATGIRSGVGILNDALRYAKINSIGDSLPRSGPLSASRLASAARSVAGRYTEELSAGLRSGIVAAPLGAGAIVAGARGGLATGGITLIIQSTNPPTPAQAQEFARQFGPELERWKRTQLT